MTVANQSYVEHLLENLKRHGPRKFEEYDGPQPCKLKRWLTGAEPYVVYYVHYSGARMALTAAEKRHFVPMELELSTSFEAYREILRYKIAQANR